MEPLLFGVAAVACPVGMGAMMWMMMRGHNKPGATDTRDGDLADLRAEVEQLRQQRTAG